MTSDDRIRKEQGERLALARKAAGYRSARAAALENEWPESTYRAHEAGTRTIGQDDAERYARRFRAAGVKVQAKDILFGGDIRAGEVQSGSAGTDERIPNVDLSKATDVPATMRFGGPRNVPVYGTAVGGGNEDGDFRFNGQTVDHVPRPQGIMLKKDVYALWVSNDSMYPKYEPGDPLYIDPHRTPSVGDDVVIELHAAELGEPGKGFIKRLEKRTPTKIVVSQFNPPKEIEFDRDEVKLIHRVIPVRELFGV